MSTGLDRQIESMPAFADILGDRETFAVSDEEGGVGDAMNRWFDRLMIQSGMETTPSMMLALSLIHI